MADDDRLQELKDAIFDVFKGNDIDMSEVEGITTEEAQDALRDEFTDPLADVVHNYVVARTEEWWGWNPDTKVRTGVAIDFATQEAMTRRNDETNTFLAWCKKMLNFFGTKTGSPAKPLFANTPGPAGSDMAALHPDATGMLYVVSRDDSGLIASEIQASWASGMDEIPSGVDATAVGAVPIIGSE